MWSRETAALKGPWIGQAREVKKKSRWELSQSPKREFKGGSGHNVNAAEICKDDCLKDVKFMFVFLCLGNVWYLNGRALSIFWTQ